MTLTVVLVLLVVALVFEYINGFHDTANSIATVVATKVLTPTQAVMLAAFANLIGAMLGDEVAKTISSGIINSEVAVISSEILICALLGGVVWNLITWWLGLPSSSSHALVGGMCGAAVATVNRWDAILWSVPADPWYTGKGLLWKIVPVVLVLLIGGGAVVYNMIANGDSAGEALDHLDDSKLSPSAAVGDCMIQDWDSSDTTLEDPTDSLIVPCDDPTAFWTITVVDDSIETETDALGDVADFTEFTTMCGEEILTYTPGQVWKDFYYTYTVGDYYIDYAFCVEAIDKAMQRFIDDHQAAGFVTLVAQNGKLVHLLPRGEADIAGRRAMFEDSMFWIASMTKPMTATVADNALLLEVLAGPDGLDPRQVSVKTATYTSALTGDARGLKIAVVKEGFGHPGSEADVDALVRKGAATFRQLGARVDEVSIPLHLAGAAIWTPIAVEGATWQMLNGNGFGFNWKGLYVTSLLSAHAAWRQRADEFSDTLKTTILFGQYALDKYRGRHYAKAQNLARALRAAYDAALAEHDLLLMPTLPLRATPLPGPGAPRMEIIQRAFEMLPNTAPFDVTGHPAMSVPCGMSDGLPVGMMLTAKHFDETSIYRAASAFEKAGDWKDIRP